MKTISKFGLALAVAALAFSCKQAENASEESTAKNEDAPTASYANPAPNLPERKLIKTADVKCKVKDVAKSTYAIEAAVNRSGGLVTSNNLQSQISERTQTKISSDSLLETTHYRVENNLTLRIPNRSLDTVMQSIVKEVDYLDYRVLKADDVALRMLANRLTQKRNTDHDERVEQHIEAKGKKLDQIADAEAQLLGKSEAGDQAAIENLSLEDQVDFSTVTLALYQADTVKAEKIAIAPGGGDYGNFGLELWDGLKSGWFVLERLLAWLVRNWSVLLILGAAGYFLRRRLKNHPIVSR